MKFKNLMFAVTALLTTGASFAQQTYVENSGSIGLIYSKKGESQPAMGTQYFIENFSAAKIDNSNEIMLVRFNAYTNEMELKINDEINVLQAKENQNIALVNGKATYQYLQYINEDNLENQGYLMVISNSPKFRIYRKEKIELIPEQQAMGGYDKYKPAQYKKLDPEYYVQVGDGKIVYTKGKKKDFARMFEGKEKEISSFIKENRINTSDEADLYKLGTYIGTIL